MKLLNILNNLLLEDASNTKASEVDFQIKFSRHQTDDRYGLIDNDVLLDRFKKIKDQSHRDANPLPTKSGVPNDKIKDIIESNKIEFARQYLRFTVKEPIKTRSNYITFICTYYDTEYDCIIQFIAQFVAKTADRRSVTVNIITSAFSHDGKYFNPKNDADVYYVVNRNVLFDNYRNFHFPSPNLIKIAAS